MSSTKVLILVFALVTLAGCASPVQKIDGSPTNLAKIKTISVIRPPELKTYAVLNFGHPGMAFGLIGGLIAASDQSSKQDKVTALVKQQNPNPTAPALADNIAAQLTRDGFEAKVEDGPWVENDGKFTIDTAAIKSSADAVLVVAPTTVGFVTSGPTSDYLPTITAVVTLLGKDRKEILYRGYHACGWRPKADGWRNSSTNVAFANFDAMMADPKKTTDSLTSAATAVATTVGEDLKR